MESIWLPFHLELTALNQSVQPEVAAKHPQEFIIKTIHKQVFLFAAPGPVQPEVAHPQELIIKTIHKQVFLFAAPGRIEQTVEMRKWGRGCTASAILTYAGHLQLISTLKRGADCCQLFQYKLTKPNLT